MRSGKGESLYYPCPPLAGDFGDSEKEDSEDSPYMEEEPPKLPDLPVRHFFPGLVVRVGRDFADAYARAVCSGDLLKVLACAPADDGYAVTFLERNVFLSTRASHHDSIIENAGNAWFQPVPTGDCLEDLLEMIDLRLAGAEDEEDEDEDDSKMERLDAVRDEIEKCQDWLSQSGERGPAPQCRSGQLAAKLFGRDHELTAWIRFLFAAVGVCIA
jgi:hypothetical protein